MFNASYFANHEVQCRLYSLPRGTSYIVNRAKRDVQYRLHRYPRCSIQVTLLTVMFGGGSFADRDFKYKLYCKTMMFSRGCIANRDVHYRLYC
jgi:hypothetical protein